MLHTLLTICAAALPFPAATQQPALPHASLPVPDRVDNIFLDETQPGDCRWVAIRPSWVENGTDKADDGRLGLLSRVAASRGLDAQAIHTWEANTVARPVVMNYRILANGKEVLAGRESLPMGKAVALTDVSGLSEILDFDVEIASGAGIFDPVVGQQFTGTSLALELLPIPGLGWRTEVALVHSTSVPGEVIEDGYAQMEGKMRLIEHIAECSFFGTAEPNTTMSVELAKLGPGKVTLEMKFEGSAPAAMTSLAADLAMVAVPTLARQENWSEYLSTWEATTTVWANTEGFLVFEGEHAVATAQLAVATAQQASKPISFQVTVQTILDGVEGEASDLRWNGWEGLPLTFAQGTVRDALTDWDVEVAQVSRIADPVFTNLFSGARGTFTGRRLADGQIEVDLDLVFSVVELGEPRSIRLAAATSGESSYDGEVPASPAQDLSIETPEVGALHFKGTYVADSKGRIMLLRSANSLFGEASRLRLVIQVSGS